MLYCLSPDIILGSDHTVTIGALLQEVSQQPLHV